jgi:hypothetical protein
MKKVIILLTTVFCNILVFSEIPFIPEEYIVFEKSDSGYDLHIKKIPGIESILITESQKDPFGKKTNYALRTETYNTANCDEIRILDGKELHTKYDAYYLVSSTTEIYGALGECFHFYLPEKVFFGYNWTRQGIIKVQPGIKLNLRLFEKKYSDYSGTFVDQWITLKVKYSESNFRENVLDNFKDFTDKSGGIILAKSDKDKLEDILTGEIPARIQPDQVADVVFIVDTTESMWQLLPLFKKEFPRIEANILKKLGKIRMGLILYKDYGESYLNKVYALTDNLSTIEEAINNSKAEGGGDIPEAAYEAIVQLNNVGFKSKSRYVFHFTDAPAHPKPRGEITKQDALDAIKKNNVKYEAIILPFK